MRNGKYHLFVWVPAELYDAVRQTAKKRGTTISQVTIEALTKEIDREYQPPVPAFDQAIFDLLEQLPWHNGKCRLAVLKERMEAAGHACSSQALGRRLRQLGILTKRNKLGTSDILRPSVHIRCKSGQDTPHD